jgi:lysophospholipase
VPRVCGVLLPETSRLPAHGIAADLLESDIAGPGGPLHVRTALSPRDTVFARLAILPGYGDHSGRYAEFMRWLAARGVTCHALDFRGHGLSAGRRGYVRRWDEFLDDLQAFRSHVTSRPGEPEVPTLLLGHSHGGLVAATAGVRGLLDSVAGCVLTSPFLRSLIHVPRWKLSAARAANACIPWLRMRSGLQPEMMTHDPAMAEESRGDQLLVRCATPGWYFSMLETQTSTRASAAAFTRPLLLLAGSEDAIADPRAAEAFCAVPGAADKTFRLLPGQRHELLRESERAATFAMILDWIRARFP